MKNALHSIPRRLAALAAAATLAAVALPAAADVDLIVKIAPPAPRYEPVPAPRVGFVWIPGYWNWTGTSHVWVAGTWQPQRPGYRYVGPVWVQRGNDWHLVRGQWARADADHDGRPNIVDRDRDGDGVRNYRDNRPNVPRNDRDNDGRPNGVDRDRDGDGVRNYRDDQPNNPRN